MQRSIFEESLSEATPPAECTTEIAALWWLRNHNWQQAHDLIDPAPGVTAAWIHALLHRMEGDQSNAAYWYMRAGKDSPANTIQQELELLLDHLLVGG